jgi:hypothetical protein
VIRHGPSGFLARQGGHQDRSFPTMVIHMVTYTTLRRRA